MTEPDTRARAFVVRDELGVFAAVRGTRALAAQLGFDKTAQEQLAIVASELATNALKHGRGGVLVATPIDAPGDGDGGGRGIRLAARDQGPPIRDLKAAMADGSDDRGRLDPARVFGRRGIGSGLGAVVRFTHRFGVTQNESDKEVWAERFVRRPLRGS